MKQRKHGPCELCERERALTFHHLIPKRVHSNKWFKKRFDRMQMASGIEVCRDCHGAVHKFATHKELGRDLNTREKLLEHPEIGKFVAWIGRRDIGRVKTRKN